MVDYLVADPFGAIGIRRISTLHVSGSDTAKTGDTVNATCENVNKSTVADMYLTDGKDDIKIAVMEHTNDKVKFQVPRIKPGRYHLAFLTANKASMIEQPVALTIEE